MVLVKKKEKVLRLFQMWLTVYHSAIAIKGKGEKEIFEPIRIKPPLKNKQKQQTRFWVFLSLVNACLFHPSVSLHLTNHMLKFGPCVIKLFPYGNFDGIATQVGVIVENIQFSLSQNTFLHLL